MSIQERLLTDKQRYTNARVVRATIAQLQTTSQVEHMAATATALGVSLIINMQVHDAKQTLIDEARKKLNIPDYTRREG